MKLICDRSALVDKLAILARGVSTRSALPVLSGILLQASEGRLDLFSTDMELSIKASLATAIEREGEIVVPARLFADVVRNLPGEQVAIEAGEAAVKVSAGRAEFSLNAWSASDFPQTSTFDTSEAFAMGRGPFVETLTKAGRAASRDETRPILTGVLMTILGDTLKMVATDSYRLAVKETKLERALETEVHAIVPVRALGEVARLAAAMGDGDIEVAIGENQALFKLSDPTGDVWIASRLIDGQFPNYQQVLPKEHATRAIVDREELLRAVRPAALLTRESTKIVKLHVGGEGIAGIQVTAVSDLGDHQSEVDATVEGDGTTVAFNAGYLTDVLQNVAADEFAIELNGPLSPGVFKPADGRDYIHVVMPVRTAS